MVIKEQRFPGNHHMADWLDEYEDKEQEIAYKHMKDSPRYVAGTQDWVSLRMPNLKSPVSYSAWGGVWSVVPMYGTTVVTMPPAPKEVTCYRLGIDETEWEKMLELARENRIRFVLTGRITSYREFEYLHPLLQEFNPPALPTFAGYPDSSPSYFKLTNDYLRIAGDFAGPYFARIHPRDADRVLALQNTPDFMSYW